MDIIRVPDVPPPNSETLCWKQGPTMSRCDRRLGHGGMHVWELSAALEALEAEVMRLKLRKEQR